MSTLTDLFGMSNYDIGVWLGKQLNKSSWTTSPHITNTGILLDYCDYLNVYLDCIKTYISSGERSHPNPIPSFWNEIPYEIRNKIKVIVPGLKVSTNLSSPDSVDYDAFIHRGNSYYIEEIDYTTEQEFLQEVEVNLNYIKCHRSALSELISIISNNTISKSHRSTTTESWQNAASFAGHTGQYKKTAAYFYSSVFPADDAYIILPVVPESISDNTSSNWQTQDIIGRGSPLAAYINTGARNVSFSFDLSRDPNEANHTNRDIDYLIKLLRSTVYSRYTSDGLIPPVTVFNFYDFRATGYVTQVNYDWKLPLISGSTNNTISDTASVVTPKYGLVAVSISMVEITDMNPSIDTILSNPSPAPFGRTSMSKLFGGTK